MRGFVVLIVLMAASFAASASTIHKLRFAQPATVLVWQDEALVGQGDRVVLNEKPSAARFDTPGSGVLVPISAGADASEQRISFRIASNSGFSVRVVTPTQTSQLSLSVTAVGENAARMPAQSSPSGDLIYDQTTKTAVRAGSPESQSITLEVTWRDGPAPILEIVTHEA